MGLKSRKAKRKFRSLMFGAFLRWLGWCIVHRPSDFGVTLEELERAVDTIMTYEGDLYTLLIEALENSRDRARESRNATSKERI